MSKTELKAITINGSITVESEEDAKRRQERRKKRKSRWNNDQDQDNPDNPNAGSKTKTSSSQLLVIPGNPESVPLLMGQPAKPKALKMEVKKEEKKK